MQKLFGKIKSVSFAGPCHLERKPKFYDNEISPPTVPRYAFDKLRDGARPINFIL